MSGGASAPDLLSSYWLNLPLVPHVNPRTIFLHVIVFPAGLVGSVLLKKEHYFQHCLFRFPVSSRKAFLELPCRVTGHKHFPNSETRRLILCR